MRPIKFIAIALSTMIACLAVPAQAGDQLTEDEFQTVCGVSIPEETSKDRCRVVDRYRGESKVETDLHFPDFSMVLTWRPGDMVQVRVDGEDWGTLAHSTSEGETRFTIGRKTFYYISDKELAQRETGG